MRLTRIKLAGFKSFVDPTTVHFPGNLTGIVGPNGCGKSNVIDAVRWVMGELSARYLRGDSMADVVFNGSTSRKPVGSASVELVFDNGDGKIGGPYASYGEVSLRRVVSRDGSSGYFINGARCRRKDITQLFLGTGLGSRSYAIIEQGTISRVIEAKPDDMRALLEEAAGISRYKERRRETESRVAETRENLERLQDVRDEVEKQIRHLTRQAATARRYQALKEDERRTAAEVLALKLRELASGAEAHDEATRERDLEMQAALAEQRSAEAALERHREVHAQRSEQLSNAQARYYQVGADLSRAEQTLEHTRELRERQRSDLAQARSTLADLAVHIARDEQQLETLRADSARLTPELDERQRAERYAAEALERAEQDLADWQRRSDEFNTRLAAASQTTQVEQARIEQLSSERRRLTARADRIAIEREELAAQEAAAELVAFAEREAAARSHGEELGAALTRAREAAQALRSEQLGVESRLEAARAERERVRRELVSIEAVQKAALTHDAGRAEEWLASRGLADRPRVAEALEVEAGWERAVETVLGDALEAVCIEQLDGLASALEDFASGRLALVEHSSTTSEADTASEAEAGPARGPVDASSASQRLAAKLIRAPAAVRQQLDAVLTGGSIPDALAQRATLTQGQSIVLQGGEWFGKSWARVNRGHDQHAGIIEREQRLKGLRSQFEREEERARALESALAAVREALAGSERERDRLQAEIEGAHRAHADLLGQLEAARARAEESRLRRVRLDEEAEAAAREIAAAEDSLARAHLALDQGLAALGVLDSERPELEGEREERREGLTRARAASEAARLAARDALILAESRRSTESSLAVTLARALEQRSQLHERCEELGRELAAGDAPIEDLERRIAELLASRLAGEAELAAARSALEEADQASRALDELRAGAEQRVREARDAMEQARLAAQETRIRRESIAEQLAAAGFGLEEIEQGLAQDAGLARWEERLAEVRAGIERLGQVNLAAIGELEGQAERKDYLDRQFKDLTDALAMLEEAMHRIDQETRARFEQTFERINAGLAEKFPRLFGGGQAHLELTSDDVLTAGVAVIARPPGKRNSTIHLLSGGEKALTAVALVFSIFDLNPA
ncbi:MAG: chromosome segregation protein SMC, partial [Steroidobacteraceae bacterium]